MAERDPLALLHWSNVNDWLLAALGHDLGYEALVVAGALAHPECPFGNDLDIDRTSLTWGLGRVCSGCGLPVRVTVEHAREAADFGGDATT